MMKRAAPLKLLFLASLLGGAAHAAKLDWQGEWNGKPLYVTVITRGHVPRPSTDWHTWGNTSTDAYLFGFGEPGVDLVVDFVQKNTNLQAQLYVLKKDQRRNVKVSDQAYELPQGTPLYVTLRPQNAGEAWLVGGKANFNLRGTFYDHVSYGQGVKAIRYNFRVGSFVKGKAAWTTAQVADPPNKKEWYPLFTGAAQKDPSVPYDLAQPLLPDFPYLSAAPYYDFYGPSQPLLFETGSRHLLTRFVGFQSAGVYAFNSYALPPRVSFEAPFAWYRFDPAIGRKPNMTMRVEQFPVGNTAAEVPEEQRTAIRMSWTTQDHNYWRYSLSVAGDHALDQVVPLGNRELNSVPYEKLPGWTATQPWRAVSFVEATEGFAGSEGIYSYSVEANPELIPWLHGRADEPITTFAAPLLKGVDIVNAHQLPEGFRGEYNLAYQRQPRLYFSPVDQQVHLENAAEGVWNIGGGQVLRTLYLGDSAQANGWQLEKVASEEWKRTVPRAFPQAPAAQLFALDNYLLYTDAQGAALRATTNTATRPLAVPTDRAAWQSFLVSLGQPKPRDPRNLKGWLSAFSGAALNVPGGQITSVRVTDTGFRFALRTPKGLKAGALPGWPALTAGTHVLDYDRAGERWQVTPATPASISGDVRMSKTQAFQPGIFVMNLKNSGTVDQSGSAALFVGSALVKSWDDLTVPGNGTFTQRFNWSPQEAGKQPVEIRWLKNRTPTRYYLDGPDTEWQGKGISLGDLNVQDTPRLGVNSSIFLSLPNKPLLGLTLLVALLGLGGYGMWRAWERLE